MSNSYSIGEYVAWKWAGGIGHGAVVAVTPARVEIDSKGKHIVRNGTAENPAITIVDHNGTPVLKLATELHKTG